MTNMDQLHEQAMDFSDQAFIAKRRGQLEEAAELYKQAFQLEARAADIVEGDFSAEPTRSVLYRSAAAMAIDAGELDHARRLIGKALAGNLPVEIEYELLDLLDSIRFTRHLEVRDVELQPGELQFAIEGKEVGPGITLTDVFVNRIRDFEKLVYRTVERKLGLPFRTHGSAKSSLVEGFSLYMTAPRSGSFAVTLRLGRQMYLPLPELDISTDVIDEILEGVSYVDKEQEQRLQELIPDQTYRENFIALVRQIAPDGDKVSSVNLTSEKNGNERQVAVKRNRKTISLIPKQDGIPSSTSTQLQPKEFTGRLLFADARKGTGKIHLVAEDGTEYTVKVSEGIADIVRNMYDEVVTVVGTPKGKSIQLLDIHPA